MEREQPTLITARLVLRPFVPGDAATVRRLAGAREIADTTLNIPHPYPEGAAERWISTHASRFAAGAEATFAVTLAGEEGPIGAAGLVLTPEHARGELGYWIGVPLWGRGYATEAARSVVSFGFGALGLRRIEAHHFTRNPASGRVLQKLGMRLEGIHRQMIRKWEVFEDVAHYAVLDVEWTAEAAAGTRPD